MSMMALANEKKQKQFWKLNCEGRCELKTMEELTKENPHQVPKARKMCYDIKSLDDIAEIPDLQAVLCRVTL